MNNILEKKRMLSSKQCDSACAVRGKWKEKQKTTSSFIAFLLLHEDIGTKKGKQTGSNNC